MVARQDFDNVVVDMGSRLDLMGTSLFKDGSTVYLVIQAGIAGLRNSNRLISQYFSSDIPKLEIVLNRFQPRSLGVAEDQITKALTRPAQWKIPNDYAAVRRMQHTAIPLALEDSPISRLIRQMARTACSLPPVQEKGSGFSFKKISRSISAKISSSEESTPLTQLELSSDRNNGGISSAPVQAEAAANLPEELVSAAPQESAPAPESQAQPAPADTAQASGLQEIEEGEEQDAGTPGLQTEAETRTYQGATYARGADGRWHLQKTEAETVNRETPAIAWPTPASIVYGTALSGTELNAETPVAGSFAYTPAAGEVLAAGTHTLSVTFTPEDTADYAEARSTVTLTVTQATPVIAWSTPSPIAYGAALSATQLNAMASVPGTFAYKPDAGEVLIPGVQRLSVEFTPEDAVNYTPAQATVSLTVTLATPAIAWETPAPIAYGRGLSAAQLNASAPVPGTLVYTPSKGEVLAAGEHTLSVSFTPDDGSLYRTAGAAVALVVNKATPIVTWQAPAAISSGVALSATQLDATALVPGMLVYTPEAGAVLPAGTHTLSVTFTPADAANYISVQATVPLTVTRATADILKPEHDPITFGRRSLFSAHELDTESQPAPAKAAPVPARKPAPHVKSAPAKAAPRVPAKQAVKVAAKPVVKAPVKEPVKAAAKPVVKAPAKEPVKAAQKHPPKAPVQMPAVSPAHALVKVGGPKAPIEVGPGLDLMGSAVLEDGTTIYLVMQPGSAGVANSNRLVSQFLSAKGPKPDFVINKFEPRSPEVAEGQSSTALTRPAHKPISRLIGQMARPSSEMSAEAEKPERKAGFSLKGIGRSIWSKLATPERVPSMTRLGLTSDPNDAGTPLGAAEPGSTARIPERPVYPSSSSTLFSSAGQTAFTSPEIPRRTHHTGAHHVGSHAGSASSLQNEPKTRTYRGATYAKGADGQWHLQQTGAEAVKHEKPAIPLPASNLVASDAGDGAESKPATAKTPPAPARKSARKAKPASRNSQAKASTKQKPVKAAAKPPVKASAKRPVKAVAKPAAKAPAKRPVKAVAKPPAKASAKRQPKTAAKLAVKAPAARLAKKPPAKPPVRKRASAMKRPVPAPSAKPVKRASAPKPSVNPPIPAL